MFCLSPFNEETLKWLLPFLATVIGGIFALYKWRSDVAVRRSLKFRELTTEIRKDEDVKAVVYMLDDDTCQWFSEDAVDSPQKAAFDKLLFHFCYVIYLYRKHFVKKSEFNTLSYEIERTLLNPQMQDYLYNMMMYAKAKGLRNPYGYLVEYGVERRLLDHRFAEKGSAREHRVELKFHHYYEKWLAEEDEYVKKNY